MKHCSNKVMHLTKELKKSISRKPSKSKISMFGLVFYLSESYLNLAP